MSSFWGDNDSSYERQMEDWQRQRDQQWQQQQDERAEREAQFLREEEEKTLRAAERRTDGDWRTAEAPSSASGEVPSVSLLGVAFNALVVAIGFLAGGIGGTLPALLFSLCISGVLGTLWVLLLSLAGSMTKWIWLLVPATVAIWLLGASGLVFREIIQPGVTVPSPIGAITIWFTLLGGVYVVTALVKLFTWRRI